MTRNKIAKQTFAKINSNFKVRQTKFLFVHQSKFIVKY